jgi:uncharacterized membrane protein (UPF0127 family)
VTRAPAVRPRSGRTRTRTLLAAGCALMLALGVAGCGDDDDASDGAASGGEDDRGAPSASEGPADPISLDDLAAASGGAPAATGADLDEAPGPADRTGLTGVGEAAASITAADGTVTGCCLLVAATDEQRQRGLMEVTDLGGYQGMVFVWDADTSGGFWMRNTPTPLSIAWFDADGDFVSSADMEPCSATAPDCPVYPAGGSYRFAVEVFQGDLDDLGVGPGSRLALGGDCAAAS